MTRSSSKLEPAGFVFTAVESFAAPSRQSFQNGASVHLLVDGEIIGARVRQFKPDTLEYQIEYDWNEGFYVEWCDEDDLLTRESMICSLMSLSDPSDQECPEFSDLENDLHALDYAALLAFCHDHGLGIATSPELKRPPADECAADECVPEERPKVLADKPALVNWPPSDRLTLPIPWILDTITGKKIPAPTTATSVVTKVRKVHFKPAIAKPVVDKQDATPAAGSVAHGHPAEQAAKQAAKPAAKEPNGVPEANRHALASNPSKHYLPPAGLGHGQQAALGSVRPLSELPAVTLRGPDSVMHYIYGGRLVAASVTDHDMASDQCKLEFTLDKVNHRGWAPRACLSHISLSAKKLTEPTVTPSALGMANSGTLTTIAAFVLEPQLQSSNTFDSDHKLRPLLIEDFEGCFLPTRKKV
jgi:hypothetical protein